MKKSLLFIALILLALYGISQPVGHGRGDFNISIGVGLFPQGLEENESIDITPLHIIADYSILRYLSAGIHFGYGTTKRDFDFTPELQPDTTLKLRETQGGTLLGGRLDFHVPLESRYTDIYIGGMAGAVFEASAFRRQSDNTVIEIDELKTSNTVFEWEAHVGLRYRFGDNFGIYFEGGYGRVYLKTGLNFRL